MISTILNTSFSKSKDIFEFRLENSFIIQNYSFFNLQRWNDMYFLRKLACIYVLLPILTIANKQERKQVKNKIT